mgnify:CR=1 FL=1
MTDHSIRGKVALIAGGAKNLGGLIARDLAGQGARVFITSIHGQKAERLPFAASGHPITDALALIVSFYGLVEALSRRRGFDPDRPPYLKKVTETV